jgi:pilus assembly protein Flp/PilA
VVPARRFFRRNRSLRPCPTGGTFVSLWPATSSSSKRQTGRKAGTQSQGPMDRLYRKPGYRKGEESPLESLKKRRFGLTRWDRKGESQADVGSHGSADRPDDPKTVLIFRPVLQRNPLGPAGMEGIAMKSLVQKVQRFLVCEDGPTAVEYAVMLALIVMVCLTAIQEVGTKASSTFANVSTQIPS